MFNKLELNNSRLDKSNSIQVWDPLVRLFHWTLVGSFFIAFITEEDFLSIHTVAGYTVLVLIGIRIIWGLIGSQYARFVDFIYSLAEIKQFLKDTFSLKAKRYIGHNPAGGAMVLLLQLPPINRHRGLWCRRAGRPNGRHTESKP